jgi:threonine/homoserine/homoserine lactone efflux protein
VGVEALPVHGLALFAAAALLVNLTPGPDMVFVAASSAAHGRRAGVMAALGVGAGCLLHIGFAVLGLAALLAASALAFSIVRWIGAAYLVWIGLAMLRARPASARDGPVVPAGRVFWQGALTNALNPKVALFFLAFLPQFVDAGAPNQAHAFVVLGMLFNAGGTLVNIAVAWFAAALRGSLAGSSAASRWLQRGAGAVFVALGLRLALSR